MSCSASLLKYESVRTLSFDHIWKEHNDFLDEKELAAWGLFSVGIKDYCQCAFCRQEIGHWEKGDVPELEHRRLSPNCPFMNRLPVGNVSTEDEKTNPIKADLLTHLKFKQLPKRIYPFKNIEVENMEHERNIKKERRCGTDIPPTSLRSRLRDLTKDSPKNLEVKHLENGELNKKLEHGIGTNTPPTSIPRFDTPTKPRRTGLRELLKKRPKVFRCCSV